MKRITGIVGVAAAALLISGCSASGSAPAKSGGTHKGGTLTVLTSYTAIDLDPARGWNSAIEINGLVSRALTTWDVEPGKAPEVVPDLATDTGTPSDDGKTWTYHLKDGIEFQDGTPITSADIKYGLERSFAPELAGGLSYHKQLLVGGADYAGPYGGKELDSIQTPDAKTIVFHLNTPYGAWPWIASMAAFAPVPKTKDDPSTYGKSPVASGPYQVESNVDGSQTVLVRNKHWDPKTDRVRTAGPDEIVFRQSQNIATATQALIGDAGPAKSSFSQNPLGAAELALVNANPEARKRVVTSGAATLTYLAMNTQRGPLKDLKVRQALEYAIDRRSIVISQGGSQAALPATTVTFPGIPGHEDFDLYPAGKSGNVDKAKELLKEAGYDGTPLELWVANDEASQAAAQAVQQGLQRAGVKIDIRPMDSTAMYSDAHGGNTGYDLMLTWWTPDFPSPIGFLQLMFDSSELDGGYNFARYSNPEVDAGIAKAAAETDPSTAAKLWADLEKRIMADAPVLPLYFSRSSYMRGSDVENYYVGDFPPYQNYLRVSLAR